MLAAAPVGVLSAVEPSAGTAAFAVALAFALWGTWRAVPVVAVVGLLQRRFVVDCLDFGSEWVVVVVPFGGVV